MNISKNENGITLVELLLAMLISGMLITVIFKLYAAATASWNSVSIQSQNTVNILRLNEYLSIDIKNCAAIKKVTKTRCILTDGHKWIQYRADNLNGKLVVTREISAGSKKKWHQIPGYPVAEFTSSKSTQIPVLVFKKISGVRLEFDLQGIVPEFTSAISGRN